MFISCLLFPFSPVKCFAADFKINPINIFFDAKQKSTVLTVKNNAEEKLTLQVNAIAWSQDEEGKDIYLQTEDIIVFPKIFSMEKDEERIIRVGIKVYPGTVEKTYRIYLEEIPPPREQTLTGATLRTLMKVGVPVFIAPLKATPEGKIEKADISQGTLTFLVLNKGNLHFIMRGIKIEGFDKEGTQVFTTDLGGWYVLSGRSKQLSVKVPRETCVKIANVNIEVTADVVSLKESVHVQPEMCSP
jgi:fimbrial chaperone protein